MPCFIFVGNPTHSQQSMFSRRLENYTILNTICTRMHIKWSNLIIYNQKTCPQFNLRWIRVKVIRKTLTIHELNVYYVYCSSKVNRASIFYARVVYYYLQTPRLCNWVKIILLLGFFHARGRPVKKWTCLSRIASFGQQWQCGPVGNKEKWEFRKQNHTLSRGSVMCACAHRWCR